MKQFTITIFLIFSSFFSYGVKSEIFNYRFKQLGLEEGLPQSTVFCVFQDSRDFIWIGTYDGLCRFDGENLKVFSPNLNDKYTVNSGVIYAIEEGFDGNLYIATAGGGLNIYNPETEVFKYIKPDSSLNSIIGNILYDVYQASDSSIWIASYNGVSRYFPSTEKMLSFEIGITNNNESPGYSANCFYEDQNASIWVGTFGGGIYNYNRKANEFVAYPNTISSDDSFDGNIINQIVPYCGDTALLNTSNGIYKFNTANCTYSKLDYPKCVANSIVVDEEKSVWIASDAQGILKVYRSGQFHNIYTAQDENTSSSLNKLNYIYQDNHSNVWVGVRTKGLVYCSTIQSPFYHYYKKNTVNSLIGNEIYGFAEDDDSNYWVGTLSGLSIVNSKERIYTNLISDGTNKTMSSNSIYDIINDGKGNMWLVTSKGVDKYSLSKKEFRHYKNVPNDSTSLPNTEYFCLGVDKNSDVWVGTYQGVIRYSNEKDIWISKMVNDKSDLFNGIVWFIYSDSKGQLWFCTDRGLFRYDFLNNSVVLFNEIPTLLGSEINYIHEDAEGIYWIATQTGLVKFNPKTKEHYKFETKDGLPNNVIYSILESDDNIWVSSNKGISKLNKSDYTISNFDVSDGLQSNEFNIAALKTKSGICLFGGINGITAFYPDHIVSKADVPTLFFTGLSLNGFNTLPNEKRNGKVPLEKSILLSNSIDISHKEKLIILDFAAIEYVKSDKIFYRYRILPDSKNWINLKNKNSITLTMLPPGKYTIEIQSTDTEQVWANNTEAIQISIKPPIYKRTWVFIIEAIIAALLIIWYIKHRTNRIRLLNINLERTVTSRTFEIQAQQKELEQQRDRIIDQKIKIEKSAENLELKVQHRTKELLVAKEAAEASERLKTAFLANMSHEIRTPMNAIVGFADILVTTEVSEDEKVNYLEIIQSNSDSLLNLLNDILDISIIESGKINLSLTSVSVHDLLWTLYKSFEQQSILKSKPKLNITLVESDWDNLFVNADLYRLQQVLSNLISNAIKYTKEGTIEISAFKQDDYVCFKVKDTGIGIRSENIDSIFDRFHKVDDGDTNPYRGGGLGLAISKNLVELMEGKIWLESGYGMGSVFYVNIPI